jgi:hypothetical protein
VLNLWTSWVEATRFAAEAQTVVWLRLILLASGRRHSRREAMRMVSEKLVTFADAEFAAAKALAEGHGLLVAAQRAYSPVRRRVHANNRRLLRELH